MATFSVMPMSKEIELKPGEVYNGSITVSVPADSSENFDYQVVVSPYSVVDEYYTADFVSESDWSKIVGWIEITDSTGTIEPNGQKEIKYKITVPADAPAGGQYAMLSVRSNTKDSSEEGVAVNNVFEMASIIYAKVAGETVHEGEVLTNSIPGFVTNGSPEVSVMITNTGNVHEAAYVTLTVKNAFTGQSVFPLEDDANVFSEIVMPDSTRYITRKLDAVPMLGVFEVTQDISYIGGDAELMHNVKTMIVCPLWFLLLLMLTVGAFIGAIFALIQKHRKNRKVF